MKMHGLKDGPYWLISYSYFLALSVLYMLFFVIFGSLIGKLYFNSLMNMLLGQINLQRQILIHLLLFRSQIFQNQWVQCTGCFFLHLYKFADCPCIFCGIFLFICQDGHRLVNRTCYLQVKTLPFEIDNWHLIHFLMQWLATCMFLALAYLVHFFSASFLRIKLFPVSC